MPATFHGTTIGNHDLKIIDNTNMEIDFLGNEMIGKIMVVSIVNEDDDIPMKIFLPCQQNIYKWP
jgi:hypothetical protein